MLIVLKEESRGTIAFLVGGAADKGLSSEEGEGDETVVALFRWASLRFPQERGLIRFGTKVNMTTRYVARWSFAVLPLLLCRPPCCCDIQRKLLGGEADPADR